MAHSVFATAALGILIQNYAFFSGSRYFTNILEQSLVSTVS